MRRFRVASLPAGAELVALDAEASHHLLHVLRAAPGERVGLFDGAGLEVEARLVDGAGGVATVALEAPPRRAAPAAGTWLLLAVLKGPAMDTALRMATEAGATAIWPVLAQRSVARGERVDRWERITRAAAQQCGRADEPEVLEPRPLAQALAALPAGVSVRVAVPGAARCAPASGPVAVLVGPEGGWTAEEVALARRAGAEEVGLGRWVLRADTAAAVAVALSAPE